MYRATDDDIAWLCDADADTRRLHQRTRAHSYIYRMTSGELVVIA